ncbi:hypothetical protein E2C01_052452 [Portunus trituberculatus]|uniref:Uncharacterized protein n=1 Tax=Portunus trituberculatus TaxID=210409 RepID=A0A5B7GN15_PORTR|nr:hypothetical protein [Portunus trituberculatus]
MTHFHTIKIALSFNILTFHTFKKKIMIKKIMIIRLVFSDYVSVTANAIRHVYISQVTAGLVCRLLAKIKVFKCKILESNNDLNA